MLPTLAAARQGAGGRLVAGMAMMGAAAAAAVAHQTPVQAAVEADAGKPAGALSSAEFRAFKLIDKEKLTHNTWRLRFELPNNQVSGLFVASCLVTRAMISEGAESKAVVRPYTPVSPPDTRGYMELVVKSYPQGKMSKHVCSLKVGDELEMKGPIPKIPYTPNMKKALGMVAGGTGITPMLQVIDAVLANPEDKTTISLVYGSLSPGEIILKSHLDRLAAKHPDKLKIYYVVDNPGWFGGLFWRGGKGFINADVLRKHLPPPDKDNLVLVCGPPGLMGAVSGPKAKDFSQGELSGALKELGYSSSQVFKF